MEMVRVRCPEGHVVQLDLQLLHQQVDPSVLCPVCASEWTQTVIVLPERLRLE